MKALSLAMLALTASTALADDWKHISLTSNNGTIVRVDYLTTRWNAGGVSAGLGAEPLWLNVVLPEGANCNGPARAIIRNLGQTSSGYSHDNQEKTQAIELSYAGQEGSRCRFSGKATALVDIEIYTRSNHWTFTQALAVMTPGGWLVDPVSGMGEFTFRMQ